MYIVHVHACAVHCVQYQYVFSAFIWLLVGGKGCPLQRDRCVLKVRQTKGHRTRYSSLLLFVLFATLRYIFTSRPALQLSSAALYFALHSVCCTLCLPGYKCLKCAPQVTGVHFVLSSLGSLIALLRSRSICGLWALCSRARLHSRCLVDLQLKSHKLRPFCCFLGYCYLQCPLSYAGCLLHVIIIAKYLLVLPSSSSSSWPSGLRLKGRPLKKDRYASRRVLKK